MPGAFHYSSAETAPDPQLLGVKCNEVEIGSVPPEKDKIDLIAKICSAMPIDQSEDSESGWNCQSWTVSVVEEMKKAGSVDGWITEDYLRGLLKEI